MKNDVLDAMGVQLKLGDCLESLRLMADNSVDSIVTDPPYGLKFMGKKWDYDVPSVDIWRECLRVLKPGGHLLAFAGTRTQHRMAVRIEDAGFEIRDMIAWVYGCLSEDSEVLTEDGWMPYNRATQKNILAYDLQNDIYQWERPSRWNEYRVESDTAYRIQSGHTDQIVSRGHRCIVERGGMLAFVPADELAGVERVPYLRGDFSALPQGRGELLLKAVLREGEGLAQAAFSERQGQEMPCEGVAKGKKPSMEGRSDLFQAKGQVRGSIDQVCALPGEHDDHGAQGRVRDGASACGGAGDWQAPDAAGMCAPHQPRRDGQSAGEPDAVCDQCGSQEARARPSYQTTVATVTAIEYSGLIWCPTVSTGAFVARRNGKVFITGNSGFPKSLDVSKAIDKAAGAERDVLGTVDPRSTFDGRERTSAAINTNWRGAEGREDVRDLSKKEITAPATEAARQWQGWGTALKPALEPITVARKPLIGTVASNVLAHGTGALNIDGCRVGDFQNTTPSGVDRRNAKLAELGYRPGEYQMGDKVPDTPPGRWPANLIHDGSDEVLAAFPDAKGQQGALTGAEPSNKTANTFGEFAGRVPSEPRGDTGSAARFFYCSKASRKDRGDGNNHPTVKPTDLMRYLCRLVTPPGGTVLDAFMGSGSTGKAAVLEGFNFIGCEISPDSMAIAQSRILNAIQIKNDQR